MHWAKFWREIRLCNKGTQIIHPFDSWPSNLIIKSQIQIKSGRIILTLLESHHAGSQIKVRQEGDYKQISLTRLHPCSYYSFIQRPQQRARRPEHHVGGLQLQIRQGQYLLGQDQWELSDVNTVFLHPGKKKKNNRWSLSIIQSVISGDFLSQLVLLETEKLAHWVENRFSSMEVRSGFQLLSIYSQ